MTLFVEQPQKPSETGSFKLILHLLESTKNSALCHPVNCPTVTARETIEKLHKYGAGSAMPILYALDFNSLKEIFDQLKVRCSQLAQSYIKDLL